MEVRGIKVGHFTNTDLGTGVTVFITDEPAPCSLHIHGFAPSTRQVDSLRDNSHAVDRVDAVLFTGGSAYGLDCAAGVMRYLRENGRGANFGMVTVPIVPTAVIFDLFFKKSEPPLPDMAYRACEEASSEVKVMGSVGAGCGATVGKTLTARYGMKGGFGAAQTFVGDVEVNVFMVINAFGDIVDPFTGQILAGARNPQNEGKFLNAAQYLKTGGKPFSVPGENTTLILVQVHGKLNRSDLRKVALAASSALSRFIVPSPSPYDGDAAFAMATGTAEVDVTAVCATVRDLVPEAGIKAIKEADGFKILPAWKDMIERNEET